MPRKTAALLLFIAVTPVWATECDSNHVAISSVQGAGDESPLLGQRVTVQGIVTLDLRQPGGFQGFYLQQALSGQDRDAPTSEGLFVHTRAGAGQAGDQVVVSGEVTEYHGLTSLTGVSRVWVCDQPGLPTPRPFDPADIPPEAREALEGMLVQTLTPLTITDTWNLARYGELVLAPSLQWVATQQMPPGADSARLHARQETERLILDDGHRRQNPRPVPYLFDDPSSPGTPLRVGDRVAPLTGILDYRFGHWRLQPMSTPRILHTNPRQMPPQRHPGTTLRVVSLNLGNLFNGNGEGGGFPTPRGAATQRAYRQQLDRLVHQIQATDPDILAVSELENDGDGEQSALADLARALGDSWHFVSKGRAPHGDAIRTGLLYRGDRVSTQGQAAWISNDAFRQWHRPALAQTFRAAGGGEPLTVVSVHLKSKSCRSARSAQQDQGDGQGCFAAARQAAAIQLGQWQPDTAGRNPPILLAGDFNAYAREAPLRVLADAGYTDLIANHQGLEQQTFRYHGRQGTLDYHLANKALGPRVLASYIWSSNAEEPRLWDYDADDNPSVPASFPWRASDHNPVITDLRL